DAVPVPIATSDDYLQRVVRHLGARCDSKRTTVQRVHAVRIDVARQVRRAANAADGQHFVRVEAELDDGLLQGVEHAEVAAARAPVWIGVTFQVLDSQRWPFFDL